MSTSHTTQAQETKPGNPATKTVDAARFSALSVSAIADDPRLAQRINLPEGKTYHLGELFEELSRQTGVSISADDADSASGKRITVALRDVPLSQAMNAVWSLLSYQRAYWHWNRTGTGTFAYRLSRSSDARQYGVSTRQRVQKSFEDEATTLLRSLNMTQEERKILGETNPTAATYLGDERIRTGLKLLASLPEATRQAVLRGEQRMDLRVADLPPSEQAIADTLWNDVRGSSTTSARDVVIRRNTFPGGISPWLMIGVGDENRTSGRGYVGGVPFEKEWQQRLGEEWQLPGDKSGDDREGQPLKKSEASDAPKTGDGRDGASLARHLSEVSQASPLSFLARLPTELPRQPAAPAYGKTLESYLATAQEQSGLRHKWRDGILLLEYRGNLTAEESAVPWAFVKELRASEGTAAQGVLPLSLMAKAAYNLTPPQLFELAGEFPIMTMVADWQKTFTGLHRSPKRIDAIVSERGLRIVEMEPLPPGLEVVLDSLKKEGRAAPERIRFSRYEGVGQNKEKITSLGVYLLDKDGDTVYGQSYPYKTQTVKAEPTKPAL
ncbi:MAG: hypothetical protein H8F28_14110 [Fibrella sp.]|nr:hypothetical protein [Armatimonadota bacterium]